MLNKDLSIYDYVSLEAAKALKSIGFNLPTHTHYGRHGINTTSDPESWLDNDLVIDRPILQKAVEWLRETQRVSLRINWSESNEDWFYDYLDLSDGSYMDSDDYYTDYNEAVNVGICEICEYIRNYKFEKV